MTGGGGGSGKTCHPLTGSSDSFTTATGTCAQGEAGEPAIDPSKKILKTATTLAGCKVDCDANMSQCYGYQFGHDGVSYKCYIFDTQRTVLTGRAVADPATCYHRSYVF